jgi:hypothetical protein
MTHGATIRFNGEQGASHNTPATNRPAFVNGAAFINQPQVDTWD